MPAGASQRSSEEVASIAKQRAVGAGLPAKAAVQRVMFAGKPAAAASPLPVMGAHVVDACDQVFPRLPLPRTMLTTMVITVIGIT
ncbi:MAG: hypothetical protein PWP40_1262 [Rhodocyclaceae bacterium]|nr:hypothetical protein [Rhodocyclaceae bacterium]